MITNSFSRKKMVQFI